MKKFLFLILLFVGSNTLEAQLLFSGYGNISYNGSSFFKDFRNYYNEINAATLKDNLGSPELGAGYSYALGYRVLQLSTSVSHSHMQARTSAQFQNSTKRIIRYEYDYTAVNIGYFNDWANAEFSIETGLMYVNTNAYAYAIMPNKEKDFFTGISQQLHWVNLGMNLKFNYLRRLSTNLFLDFMIQGFYINDKTGLAPVFSLGPTSATINYIGGTASIGLTLKVGE